MPSDRLTPSRELYLMTNMMNGHALTSEEALEVWQEVHCLRAERAAAEQAALERAAQVNEVAADSFEPPMNELDQIATTVLVENAKKIRSLSTGNALDLERAKARLEGAKGLQSALHEMLGADRYYGPLRLADEYVAAASMGIQLDASPRTDK